MVTVTVLPVTSGTVAAEEWQATDLVGAVPSMPAISLRAACLEHSSSPEPTVPQAQLQEGAPHELGRPQGWANFSFSRFARNCSRRTIEPG